jgi:hypothetical protein
MSGQTSLEIMTTDQAGYASAAGTVGEKAKEAFEALGSLLCEAIGPFKEKLVETTTSADEIEVKLDLALRGGGKWVVVSMEGAATVSVKLVWKRPQ